MCTSDFFTHLPAPSHTLPSPMQTDEQMRALDLKHSPSLVLLFNWSFISDNQFISPLAAGCIDLLSQAKVKCTLLLPQRRQPQAGVPAMDILCYLFFLLRVFLVSPNLPLPVTHCIIVFWGYLKFITCFLQNANWSPSVSSRLTLIQNKMF